MGVEVVEVEKGFSNVEWYDTEWKQDQFIRINNAFKKITGGKGLDELIEEGRVFDMKGKPLGRAGLKENFEDSVSAYGAEACVEMKNFGIMILDENAGNRPRHVYFNLHKNERRDIESMDMYASEPISKEDLPQYLNSVATKAMDNLNEPVKPVKPEEPGFFSRLWNRIKGFFGGRVTDPMNEYRDQCRVYGIYLSRYNDAKKEIDALYGHENEFEIHVKDAADLTVAARNSKILREAVYENNFGYDYEYGSAEWRENKDCMDAFQDGVFEIASYDPDVMKLVVGMNKDGSLQKLFDAYKNDIWDANKEEEENKQAIQDMLKDAVANAASKEKEAEKVPVKATEQISKSEVTVNMPS